MWAAWGSTGQHTVHTHFSRSFRNYRICDHSFGHSVCGQLGDPQVSTYTVALLTELQNHKICAIVLVTLFVGSLGLYSSAYSTYALLTELYKHKICGHSFVYAVCGQLGALGAIIQFMYAYAFLTELKHEICDCSFGHIFWGQLAWCSGQHTFAHLATLKHVAIVLITLFHFVSSLGPYRSAYKWPYKELKYSGRGKFMPLPLKSKILETPGSSVTDDIKMFPL